MAKKFRAAAACRIAGIDRHRFNEAVAAGNYPCAPRVQRGSSRLFDENDLVALFIYGRLLEEGIPPKRSGEIVCKVRLEMSADETESEFIFVRSLQRISHVFRGSEVNEPPRSLGGGSFKVLYRMSFDIENVREFIRREMTEEASVFGEDEAD